MRALHSTMLDAINSSRRLPTCIHERGSLRGLPHSNGFLCRRLFRESQLMPLPSPTLSQVLVNLLVMSRDEHLYPDPEVFRPERFLGHSYTKDRAFDLWNYIFGTGKRYQLIISREVAWGVFPVPRKCPGVHLTHSSLWLVIARVIATFDIRKKIVNDVPVEVEREGNSAFFMKVRSESQVEKTSFSTNPFHRRDLRWPRM